jgi:hypothetical protein
MSRAKSVQRNGRESMILPASQQGELELLATVAATRTSDSRLSCQRLPAMVDMVVTYVHGAQP